MFFARRLGAPYRRRPMTEDGRFARPVWPNWSLNAVPLLLFGYTLSFLDARVRGILADRLIVRPAEVLMAGSDQIGSLVASAAGTTNGLAADNPSLVTCAVATVVLVALMHIRR